MEATAAVEEVVVKNATSAARSATSPVTAQRVEDTAEEAMEVEVEATEEDTAVVVAAVVLGDRPVTLAVAMAICLATAPRARSATTVCLLAAYTAPFTEMDY